MMLVRHSFAALVERMPPGPDTHRQFMQLYEERYRRHTPAHVESELAGADDAATEETTVENIDHIPKAEEDTVPNTDQAYGKTLHNTAQDSEDKMQGTLQGHEKRMDAVQAYDEGFQNTAQDYEETATEVTSSPQPPPPLPKRRRLSYEVAHLLRTAGKDTPPTPSSKRRKTRSSAATTSTPPPPPPPPPSPPPQKLSTHHALIFTLNLYPRLRRPRRLPARKSWNGLGEDMLLWLQVRCARAARRAGSRQPPQPRVFLQRNRAAVEKREGWRASVRL